MKRQTMNRIILNVLTEMNEKCPDQRFGQLLVNCGVTNQFVSNGYPVYEVLYNEESEETLEKMKVAIEKIITSTTTKKSDKT